MLPERAQDRLRYAYHRVASKPKASARASFLQDLEPVTRDFGMSRGTPIDRHYIEGFLARQVKGSDGSGPIRGRVMEIQDSVYARKFGDPEDVTQIDVLDIAEDNPKATLVADLADGRGLASGAFDCIICTQTLLLIYDVRSAVATLHRILRPGGALLATVPGISQICRPEMGLWGDHWRFTTASLERLLAEHFEPSQVTVESHGNVFSTSAFLYGLAAEDLRPEELDVHDPDYQLIVSARATKRA